MLYNFLFSSLAKVIFKVMFLFVGGIILRVKNNYPFNLKHN